MAADCEDGRCTQAVPGIPVKSAVLDLRNSLHTGDVTESLSSVYRDSPNP